MPDRYVSLLAHYGLPLTVIRSMGKSTVKVDWSKLIFPLIVASLVGLGSFLFVQSRFNGVTEQAFDSLTRALRDNTFALNDLRENVARNNAILETLSKLPERINKAESRITTIEATMKGK